MSSHRPRWLKPLDSLPTWLGGAENISTVSDESTISIKLNAPLIQGEQSDYVNVYLSEVVNINISEPVVHTDIVISVGTLDIDLTLPSPTVEDDIGNIFVPVDTPSVSVDICVPVLSISSSTLTRDFKVPVDLNSPIVTGEIIDLIQIITLNLVIPEPNIAIDKLISPDELVISLEVPEVSLIGNVKVSPDVINTYPQIIYPHFIGDREVVPELWITPAWTELSDGHGYPNISFVGTDPYVTTAKISETIDIHLQISDPFINIVVHVDSVSLNVNVPEPWLNVPQGLVHADKATLEIYIQKPEITEGYSFTLERWAHNALKVILEIEAPDIIEGFGVTEVPDPVIINFGNPNPTFELGSGITIPIVSDVVVDVVPYDADVKYGSIIRPDVPLTKVSTIEPMIQGSSNEFPKVQTFEVVMPDSTVKFGSADSPTEQIVTISTIDPLSITEGIGVDITPDVFVIDVSIPIITLVYSFVYYPDVVIADVVVVEPVIIEGYGDKYRIPHVQNIYVTEKLMQSPPTITFDYTITTDTIVGNIEVHDVIASGGSIFSVGKPLITIDILAPKVTGVIVPDTFDVVVDIEEPVIVYDYTVFPVPLVIEIEVCSISKQGGALPRPATTVARRRPPQLVKPREKEKYKKQPEILINNIEITFIQDDELQVVQPSISEKGFDKTKRIHIYLEDIQTKKAS